MYLLTDMPPATPAAYPKANSLPFYLCELALVNKSAEYFEYYRSLRKPVVLISYDSGKECSEGLLDVANEMRYPVVVSPFTPGDGAATTAMLLGFKDDWKRRYGGYGSPGFFMQPKMIAVATGATWEDFWLCYQFALTSGADMIAIPNNIDFIAPVEQPGILRGSETYRMSARRVILMRHLYDIIVSRLLKPGRFIKHCLIELDHPAELSEYGSLGSFVHSVWTRMPFAAAINNVSLWDWLSKMTDAPRFNDVLKLRYSAEVFDGELLKLLRGNIRGLISMMQLDKKEMNPSSQDKQQEGAANA